jgi:phytoene/squalene synthetase
MTPGLPMPSKTHGKENFPVASVLIAPKHRATILAYYRFARGADDVADSPSLAPDAKLAWLDLFEATLICCAPSGWMPSNIATRIGPN